MCTVTPLTFRPDVSILRDRFLLLGVARDFDPTRLTTRANYALECHGRVALDMDFDSPEEIYENTIEGGAARAMLQELIPDWFDADPAK